MELVDRIQPGIAHGRRIRKLTRSESMESPIADLLSVDYFLSWKRSSGTGPSPVIIPNANTMPRAFLVPRAETMRGDALLRRLASPDFDPARVVYLSPQQSEIEPLADLGWLGGFFTGKRIPTHPFGSPLKREDDVLLDVDEAVPGGPAGLARILSYRGNELTIETQAAESAWLVLAETYYPG